MYPSNFQKNFRLLVCAPANQQTKCSPDSGGTYFQDKTRQDNGGK